MKMVKIGYFLCLARIKFLLYSPILYTLGYEIFRSQNGETAMRPYFIGLIFVLNTHIMTHFFNEYYNLKADRLNSNPSPWTGGSRILVRQIFSPKVSLMAGYITMAFSTLIAILFFAGPSLWIAALIIALSYFYSTPPISLENYGLGETTVTLVLNILVPMLAYSLQANMWPHGMMILVPPAIIEFIRMMVMNMADREGDKLGGKKTLVVRIGMDNAVSIFICGQIACYLAVLALYGTAHVSFQQALLMFLSAPLGGWIAFRLARGGWKDKKRMWALPFWASTQNALIAAGALIGVILSRKDWSFFDIGFVPLYVYVFFLAYQIIQARLRAAIS